MNPILVVDDDDDVRNMLCLVLQHDGYPAVGAADGQEALDRMRGDTPALVFVDLMMPRMDGTTLIRRMAADRALADIPVAIMSGQRSVPQEVRGHATAHLVKPVELDDILGIVSRIAGPGSDATAGEPCGSDQGSRAAGPPG
jgi:CheY-like chemotaxis protein